MKSVFGIQVGFTGTREGMSDHQKTEITQIFTKLITNYGSFTLHHGDCIGADTQAHSIANMIGGMVVIHPPSDSKHRAFCKNGSILPVSPYLDRNRDIVNACDFLIGCPKQSYNVIRSGTWYTIRYAKKTIVPVHVILRNGNRITYGDSKIVI